MYLAAPLVFAACAAVLVSCEDGATEDASTVVLAGEAQLFPGLDHSTGLIPDGAPVQASFTISASGTAKLGASVVASGSDDEPVLVAKPGSGTLEIQAGFAMLGQLKIEIDGLPSYDGPIPGIENVQIPITGSASFDPFGVGEPVEARADVPPTDLPGIPLPAGIPGQLVIAVGEGSFVGLTFTPSCAGVDDGAATFTGTLERAGVLVLRPRIEIEIPFVGTSTFDIPEVAVDLALGATELAATGAIGELVGDAPDGERAEGRCEAGKGEGQGGAGAGGGNPATSSSGGGGTCGTDDDCAPPATCVGGVCG